MILISLAHIRALLPLASTDETRYNLNGINIGKDGEAVASNGHSIAVIKEAVRFDGNLQAALRSKFSNPRWPGLILRRDVLEGFAKQHRSANGVVVDAERGRACLVWCDLKRGMNVNADDDGAGWVDDVFVRATQFTEEQLSKMTPKLAEETRKSMAEAPIYPDVWQVVRHEKGGFGDVAKEKRAPSVALALHELARFEHMARLDVMGVKIERLAVDKSPIITFEHGADDLQPVALRFPYSLALGMIMPCRK